MDALGRAREVSGNKVDLSTWGFTETPELHDALNNAVALAIQDTIDAHLWAFDFIDVGGEIGVAIDLPFSPHQGDGEQTIFEPLESIVDTLIEWGTSQHGKRRLKPKKLVAALRKAADRIEAAVNDGSFGDGELK